MTSDVEGRSFGFVGDWIIVEVWTTSEVENEVSTEEGVVCCTVVVDEGGMEVIEVVEGGIEVVEVGGSVLGVVEIIEGVVVVSEMGVVDS